MPMRIGNISLVDKMKISDETDSLQSDAKMNFRMRRYELAEEQAAKAMLLFDSLSHSDSAWDTLCTRLADMMLVLGRHAECDRLMKLALSAGPTSGNERGTREAFYAQFLLRQGRLDEAEEHALASIRAPLGEIGFAKQLLREIRNAKATK